MTLLLPLFLQTVVATAGPMQAPSPKRTEHHHLVTIRIKDARTLERVVAMDLDLAACADLELPVKLLEVIADDEDLRRLKSSGLDHEIVIRNLEDSIEKRLSRYVFPRTLTPPLGQGAMGGHYTWAQVIAILDSFSKANPKICSAKASIGKSHQGRDLWMVKISDNVNVDENEPEVLFDAMHHAREPLSMETTLLFMDWLIDNYGKDSEATYLVDHRELYFVPVVNPDGYEYNRSIRSGGGGMWRKNRRVNNASSFGVDLNRNYPTGWSAPFGGNSTNPLSNVYRGPKPLSEPEALALDNFAKSRSFTLGCSAHTYGDILLRPWGYQRADPANLAQYRIVDAAATKQNGIRSGAASKILYIAAGTALDHYHAGHGMISYTPELGRSSEGGFWPNPTRTVSIARRHQHMFRTLARYAGGVISVASASLSEAPGGNNNGKVDPGETAWVTLSIGNRGAGLPTSAVLASLKSLTAGVTILKGQYGFGRPARFSIVKNPVGSLVLQVASTFRGLSARIEIAVNVEGTTIRTPLDLTFVNPISVIGDDFEKDLGFVRAAGGTATTGRFERAAPQRTTYLNATIQPGTDHTPGNGTLCWVTDGRAGPSVGSYDVDGGRTGMLSPVIDLAHIASAKLAVWIHYAESVSPGDPFMIDVSSDGGINWRNLYSRNTPTGGWIRLELAMGTVTDKMQLRFTAQDFSPSLVEACVDDLEIMGVVDSGSLTILGSGARASTARMALQGAPGAIALPLLSAGTADITLPGIGRLLLDPTSLVVSNGLAYGSAATLRLDLVVPNDPSSVGKRVYFQQLLVNGSALKLGNRTSITIR